MRCEDALRLKDTFSHVRAFTVNDLSLTCAVLRPLLSSALVFGLCLTLPACGGSDQAASDSSANHTRDVPAPATQVSQAASAQEILAAQKSADASSTASASASAPDGVRPDVNEFIVGLTASETQRSTLYQTARAMQAVLDVDLSRRSELQTVVNDLAQAKSCLQAQWAADSEATWKALSTQTYDTLVRRLKQSAFLVVARLLTTPPGALACGSTPPAAGSVSGGGAVPPTLPPTPPTQPGVAQQLAAEIIRLEREGVLPALDRGTDIRGPDTNTNGVRDDIDAYVAALPLTDPQRSAAIQRARSQQSKLLVDPSDTKAVQDLSVKSMAATKCMDDVFVGGDAEKATELAFRIAAITANTPERAQRHLRFMAALSGTSVEYPSGNTCE